MKARPAPAVWPYPHNTVARMDEIEAMKVRQSERAIERWWAARTPHHQPTPTRHDNGGEGQSGMDVSSHREIV